MSRRNNKILLGGFVLLLTVALIWTSRLTWLPWIGNVLTVSDPLQHCPIVMILPGSEDTRPFVAAGLMNAGYADSAIIPETRANPDVLAGETLSTAELTREILIRRGIPKRRIVILSGASDSTFDDAQALDRYFQQSGATDVIIVTNAYHSRRARWTFRHVLPQYQDHLRFYAAPNAFETNRWWISRKGRTAVLSELLKFAYYVTYHGHGWLWCVISVIAGGFYLSRGRRGSHGPDKGYSNVGEFSPKQSDT